ncbi:MAG: hypothetical protein LBC87_02560 [Fibromonadaceae bacterium]|nr:hypothetical protein [Fibromonadaceae bacterium]
MQFEKSEPPSEAPSLGNDLKAVRLPIEYGKIVLHYLNLIYEKGKEKKDEHNKEIIDELDECIDSLDKKKHSDNPNDVLECDIV